MKRLGVDYGKNKIGLARSSGNIAMPLEILKDLPEDAAIARIKAVCRDEGVDEVVVGMPLSMKGGEPRDADMDNEQMRTVMAFVDMLADRLDVPVVTEDERMTTQMAGALLRGHMKQDDDAVAAMVILQNYLDKKQD